MTISSPNSPTVVLVHGAWADGSSWRAVIGLLHERGIKVVAVQNPTTSLADDVLATANAINSSQGPVVLVGHSWGGTVITEAGADEKVKALVYVAALAPDVGQSSGDLIAAYPPQPAMSGVKQDSAGNLLMGVESWLSNVAQDLPQDDVRILAAVQTPLSSSSFGDKITIASWAEKPCWYVVSASDRALSSDMQRALAGKLKAHVTEVQASHMSPLSAAAVVANSIQEAVSFVSKL